MAAAVTVSFSELDAFRQCNHKHKLGYKERWTPPTTSAALAKGTLWHLVMEDHYKILRGWQELGKPRAVPPMPGLQELTGENAVMPIEQALVKASGRHLYGPNGKYVSEWAELVEWMYTGYVEQWGLDEKWQILAIEHGATVPLLTDRGGISRFRLKLKIDLIVRDLSMLHPKIWIVDHKSGRDLPKEKELDIDDQFGLYSWAMRQLGKRVFGSLHNAARTQRNVSKFQPLDERFHRTPLSRTERELDTIALEAYQTCREAYGPLNHGQRAPDSDRCRWRCDFTQACLHGRKGGDEDQFLVDLGFVQDFTRH